jgi:hypothetical protein
MKTLVTCCIFILEIVCLTAQSVGINNTGATPDESAILDIQSTDKGLLVPRMSSLEKHNIPSPADGLIVYQTDSIPGYYYFNGDHWVTFAHNSGGVDDILVVGSQDSLSIPEYWLGDTLFVADSSGILYDSGGPFGNYSNNEDE